MENKQETAVQPKSTGTLKIVWGSAAAPFLVALIWASNFTSQFPNSDATGLAQLVRPILYALSCFILFFLVWPPVFGAILGACTILRLAPSSCGRKAWFVWVVSLLPFCFSIWFFLNAPTMAKYRMFFHL